MANIKGNLKRDKSEWLSRALGRAPATPQPPGIRAGAPQRWLRVAQIWAFERQERIKTSIKFISSHRDTP
eukprot:1396736-Lingulodinium_polyedra.AAC.1